MAIRVLNEASSPGTESSASVCVIGAGVAGLVAAARLGRNKNLRVVVIESGLAQFDSEIETLNQIDNPTANYGNLYQIRFRGLGGTSRLWSGKLLPLTERDTLPRPHLGLEGWPIAYAELQKYFGEIEAFMGVDENSYEEDASEKIDSAALLARGDPEMVLRWPKRPTIKKHDLAHVFRQEIAAASNIEIWLGATVTQFETDPANGRVRRVLATSRSGKELRVRAGEFIIAAGTLESTRLLLLADRQSNGAITRATDSLGRYFNDHLGFFAGRLRPRQWNRVNQALSDRSPFSKTSSRHLHFELRPELQEAHGVGSAYFDLGMEAPESSALTQARAAVQAAKSVKPAQLARSLGCVLKDFPTLVSTAQWQILRKQKYWPTNAAVIMKIWVEQLPHRQNRIALSDKMDDLRQPKLRLEWTRTDLEEKTLRFMIEKVGSYWQRYFAGVCDIEWDPLIAKPGVRLVDHTHELAHPAGSTRMGTDPAASVVGTDLTVHRLPNLSVASASVFPTSGSANPTLSIMALALLAADGAARRATESAQRGSSPAESCA